MDRYIETILSVPNNEEQAQNYPELLGLWQSQKALMDIGQLEPMGDLSTWENHVSSLLKPDERVHFDDDQVVLDMDVLALSSARLSRLARILVSRHGVEIEGPVF
jgi:hypothetical protein